MPSQLAQANRAWESLMTAHTKLLREFAGDTVWRDHGLTMREYDVLYTLVKRGEPARIGELQQDVLLSQPALSRLVDRLSARGLLERTADAGDGRAVRVQLTAAGRQLQRTVGLAHAREVAHAVGSALDEAELAELTRLTAKLAGGAP